uniref:Uncharacterized protein n=1 Tax=Strongyloides venezuelensis TaxID=75913 RepID=A0A0K0EX84_STRVS
MERMKKKMMMVGDLFLPILKFIPKEIEEEEKKKFEKKKEEKKKSEEKDEEKEKNSGGMKNRGRHKKRVYPWLNNHDENK